ALGGAAGHRTVDRAVHRHACDGPSGCLSGPRPGPAQDAGGRWRHADRKGRCRTRLGLAAVARLRRDPPLEKRESRDTLMDTTTFMRMDTPIGVLTLAADAGGLRRIDFPPPRPPPAGQSWIEGSNDVLRE